MDIPRFIKGYLELSQGYNSAMSIDNFNAVTISIFSTSIDITSQIYVYLGFFYILLYTLLTLSGVVLRLRDTVLLSILLFPLILISFKHGFVRFDCHVLIWLEVSSLIFILIIIGIIQDSTAQLKKINKILPIIVLMSLIILLNLIAIYFAFPWKLNTFSFQRIGEIQSAAEFLIQEEEDLERKIEYIKSNIRKNCQELSLVKDTIGELPVDIIPWDIACLWAFNLNWSPRPVFQSYTVYTPYLDDVNSKKFVSNPPEFLLFSYKSIDGRYPMFDEPKTFREIICRYEYLNLTGEFLLLSKVQPRCTAIEELGSLTAKINENVHLPEYNGLVFGCFEVEYNLKGRIAEILYKPPPIYIKFILKDGSESVFYRFIPTVTQNCVLLSPYIGNVKELGLIFKGMTKNDVSAIFIKPSDSDFYNSHVKIRFLGIRFLNLEAKFLSSPSAAKLFPLQKVISFSEAINSDLRFVLYQHPISNENRSIIEFRNIYISENSKLKFGIALHPEVWDPKKGDGVVFEIYIKADEIEKLLFSKYIDPKNNLEERKWNDFEIDLTDYSGKNVTIILSTLPGPKNDASWDWAFWGDLRVVRNS